MESMPAAASPVTVGVDTHLDQHVAAVVDQAGRLLDTQAFAALTRGYVALVTWAEGFGPVERIGVEGTGTYGAGLARFARAYGLQVLEVDRPTAAPVGGGASQIRSTPRPPPGPPWPEWPPPPPRPATARSR
jgi:Transposase